MSAWREYSLLAARVAKSYRDTIAFVPQRVLKLNAAAVSFVFINASNRAFNPP